MSNLTAKKRYFRVFYPAMAIFLVASAALGALDPKAVSPVLAYGLALVPIVALLSVFWAHWRFMNEIDEFLRTIQMQAVLFGVAVVLVISFGWGFLENYVDAPRLHIIWLTPIYWLAYAAAATVLTRRATGPAE